MHAFTAISALPVMTRIAELAKLGEYESRGKGVGRFTGKFDAKRMHRTASVFPHESGCGPREKTRRLRQIERGMPRVSVG
jgi:hypothetical protein